MTPEAYLLMWFLILSTVSFFLFFAVTLEWIEYQIIQEMAV